MEKLGETNEKLGEINIQHRKHTTQRKKKEVRMVLELTASTPQK